MVSERIQRRIDSLLDEADTALVEGDWSTVDDRSQKVLHLDPGNVDALTFSAAAERALGNSTAEPAAPSPSIPSTPDTPPKAPDDDIIKAIRHAVAIKPKGNWFQDHPFHPDNDYAGQFSSNPMIRTIGG